jgi:hypothetical protein
MKDIQLFFLYKHNQFINSIIVQILQENLKLVVFYETVERNMIRRLHFQR